MSARQPRTRRFPSGLTEAAKRSVSVLKKVRCSRTRVPKAHGTSSSPENRVAPSPLKVTCKIRPLCLQDERLLVATNPKPNVPS